VRPIEEQRADVLTALLWLVCARPPSPRALLLSSCGQIATAVGMGPLKGMSREMIFVRSGLALGLISPVNDPIGAMAARAALVMTGSENHGVGDSNASDAATATFR
jgi:hypothetical protein